MIMATTKKTIFSIPVSVLVALLITTILFVGIPLLTKLSEMRPQQNVVKAVLISQAEPPPPPEPEQREEVKKKELKKESKQKKRKTQRARPQRNFQLSGLSGGLAGTIAIGGLVDTKFEVSDSLFATAFNLNEVDQPPRAVRPVTPQYPFEARAKGIEARVLVKCVIDEEGNVVEPEVTSVKPDNEYRDKFAKKAIEAINRFRFKPAKKDGKAVDCIVVQPFNFKPVD